MTGILIKQAPFYFNFESMDCLGIFYSSTYKKVIHKTNPVSLDGGRIKAAQKISLLYGPFILLQNHIQTKNKPEPALIQE